MLFSSITFLYYFLPVTLILYFAVPKHMKNAVLFTASMLFYAWGEPKYVVLMIVSIIVGYLAGRWIETYREKLYGGLILAGAILIHLGGLIYFKYADFIVANINSLTGNQFPMLKVALPIGISFYTFQIISYEVDVYRGTVKTQKNILHLATYIAMFPQLIAGPIVRYADIETQLSKREICYADIYAGILRFAEGLGKKVLIGNTLGELCEIFKVSNDKSILYFWLYALCFTLHIYYDFSGYSDMAIGLGHVFGFHFMENFNYPYISKSVTEFWRRWHMSLSQWFRDYVYIPLGGNRCLAYRWIINIGVVWFLTGLWHGAEWNFALWGLYFALILMMEKLWLGKWIEKIPVLGHVYTCLIVMFGFVLFNASGLEEAVSYVKAMVGLGGYSMVSSEFFYYIRSYAVLIIVGIVGATPLVGRSFKTLKEKAGKWSMILEVSFIVGIFVLSTAYLVDGSFNPFLYFRF